MNPANRVIARDGAHEIEIQRSRFLCSLARVGDEESAAAFIAGIRKQHWSATHNCSAFRVGPDGAIARSSDDGEPAGTAGVPMLEVLARRGLTDTVAVVTRYFGGTKLGAGGLVRAYGRAVAEAIDAVGTLRRARFAVLEIAVGYAEAGRLEHMLRAAGHRIASIDYGGQARFTVHVPLTGADGTAQFDAWLAEQTGGAAAAVPAGTVDLDVPD
ncbi:YigZ family protein [Pseudonocardia asaccharolytica DSM 44247 = NBRC 16224]|uniref:YigZ family protein n=1 Tax=Pseudonocardia asaccharolytica DSM 44247 = NBRC 16224 TaxID=1123024 RepID=A0A511D9Q0_9PSEU|nr:YigZ family protein [Pseudonocardia asaccharolytica DSM 44247 = NBRC 16224]